jgi:ABC-2 type transport system permease protein
VLAFYLALLAGTLIFLVLMMRYARPDYGVVAIGYAGMILLGAAFLAVGVFASTLTRYQLLAAAAGVVILSVFAVFAAPLAAHIPAPWNVIASKINAMAYLHSFSRGLFDSQGLVFFLSLTAGFLFLSVKTLESKRWR